MILVGELVTTRNQPTNGRGKLIPKLPMVVYKVKISGGERWVYCRTHLRDMKCTMPEHCFEPWNFANEVDVSAWKGLPSSVWET